MPLLGFRSSIYEISSSGKIKLPIDYALEFDGINNYVEVPDSDSLDITGAITIEFWLKFSSVPEYWKGIITKWMWSSEGFPGYYVLATTNESTLRFGLVGEDKSRIETGHWGNLKGWHYYSFTYNGSEVRGFLDGTLHCFYAFNGSIGMNSLPLTIGCRSNKIDFFKGAIDEVRISNISRSKEEILANYNGGEKRKQEVDEYTVALWHFDEASGDTVYDETKNNNNGIIYNAKWIRSVKKEEIKVEVDVDYTKQIGKNKLSLGTQFHSWMNISIIPELKEKTRQVHFGLVRIFIGFEQGYNPCVSWDEVTHTGTYDWTELDEIIQTIKEIGATPLICIGGGDKNSGYWLPTGMVGDWNGKGFPSNESFGIYCADIVNYTNIEKKFNVKYWEIWNEPDIWSESWSSIDLGKLTNFTKTFNNAEQYMHNIDSSILCGNDHSDNKVFLDYFAKHTKGVGFLSFHRYSGGGTWLYCPEGYTSDCLALRKASEIIKFSWCNDDRYSPREMQKKWEETCGEIIPVLCSETNLNSVWEKGTDPRIQEIIGGVWYAEELRFYILEGMEYSVYYNFASDVSGDWETTYPTEGWGFGMIKSTPPYTEWYPYLVNNLIGNNLCVGDEIFESISNETDSIYEAVSALAWKQKGEYKLLLISKVNQQVTININGFPAGEARVNRIETSKGDIQSEITKRREFTTNGYTVLLISINI
ncbi:hypothetical protein MCGE09_00423 [Thaumarchaeota archaeon SCGC AB-539-E09]|nr:hypothetical protein MCGE09_00423 [Thaumarchaeota archaeon SCGC AB-539-E09]